MHRRKSENLHTNLHDAVASATSAILAAADNSNAGADDSNAGALSSSLFGQPLPGGQVTLEKKVY